MWTLVLFYLCDYCNRPHTMIVDNLPDRKNLTIVKAISMIRIHEDRFSPQAPVYELVPPNHAHATRIRTLTPEQRLVWDDITSAKLDALVKNEQENGTWEEAELDDKDAPDTMGIDWEDRTPGREVGLMHFADAFREVDIRVNFGMMR